MKVSVKRWVQAATCDIGQYRTTVTVREPVLVSVTLCGRFSRSEALRRAWHNLNQSGQWSRSFLDELRRVK